MKIYLFPSTAGRYGGGLKGNLKHLDRIIQSELDNADFKSSFDEFSLTLSYPPLYVLPGVVGIEVDFKKYYDTFPYSRIDRRYKKIDIKLKAPEFSEHFDKAEQTKFQHTFDIEYRYKNLNNEELAKILIDKFLEAVNIVIPKLKNTDIFDFETFRSILTSLRKRITADFLNLINVEEAIEVKNNTLDLAINSRKKRKETENVKNQKFRDLRIYYKGLERKIFYPYDYQYVEIFYNLLRRKNLMCPTYHHLYIQVAQTFEECLLNSFAIDDRIVYGLSVIDFENYLRLTEKEKEQQVFSIIVNGLKDIAELDKLDLNIINETIEEIKQKGLDTELEFKVLENKTYKLTISYFSKSMEEKCPVFFTLLEKTTNKSKKILVGNAENSQIYLWLQKVSITRTQIIVKSSNSIAADVYLKDKARSMEFNIVDILNE